MSSESGSTINGFGNKRKRKGGAEELRQFVVERREWAAERASVHGDTPIAREVYGDDTLEPRTQPPKPHPHDKLVGWGPESDEAVIQSVMQRHGLTRAEAIEAIDQSGF